jgi:hypothetical protein
VSVLVDLSPRAHREAARIARWWRANRPSAPDLFDQELHVVLMQIATAPNARDAPARGAVRSRVGERVAAPSFHLPLVWFFSSGPLDDSAERQEIPPMESVRKLMARVGARGHCTFARPHAEPDPIVGSSPCG